MAGHQHLVGLPPRDQTLAVGQRPVLEGRIDEDLVLALLEADELLVGQAEAPGLRVVGGAVRDQGRSVGQGVEMRLELRQRQPGVHGHAVADDVEVRPFEVDDPPTTGVRDPGASDVPLPGYRPVEHRGAAGDLVDFERQLLGHAPQSLADPLTGDAATDRVQVRDELPHPAACRGDVEVRNRGAHIAASAPFPIRFVPSPAGTERPGRWRRTSADCIRSAVIRRRWTFGLRAGRPGAEDRTEWAPDGSTPRASRGSSSAAHRPTQDCAVPATHPRGRGQRGDGPLPPQVDGDRGGRPAGA